MRILIWLEKQLFNNLANCLKKKKKHYYWNILIKKIYKIFKRVKMKKNWLNTFLNQNIIILYNYVLIINYLSIIKNQKKKFLFNKVWPIYLKYGRPFLNYKKTNFLINKYKLNSNYSKTREKYHKRGIWALIITLCSKIKGKN